MLLKQEEASLQEALGKIEQRHHKATHSRMLALFQCLADKGNLRTPDLFNKEADLPGGGHFYAVKAKRLRAYGWFSSVHKGTFIISHYAFKRGEKLDQRDTARVIKNWRNVERSE
ncbi:hypothetical protein [Pseudomonas indica]|uniref:hypothetical protein n=1 Tax=Pseudomonas indica TaxID=137658 RepID=UPI003FD18307